MVEDTDACTQTLKHISSQGRDSLNFLGAHVILFEGHTLLHEVQNILQELQELHVILQDACITHLGSRNPLWEFT